MRNSKSHIFNRLDRIEHLTGIMIHQIEELQTEMYQWQNGELTDLYFYELLNKYWDKLNMDGV